MNHLEDKEQAALMEWAVLTALPADIKLPSPNQPMAPKLGDYLFAIPNGGKRGIIEARRMKGLGVKPGVFDLFCPIPLQGHHGLWIELKRPLATFASFRAAVNMVSYQQVKWWKQMLACGYAATVCYGWDEARILLRLYLGGLERVGTEYIGFRDHYLFLNNRLTDWLKETR